MTVVLWVALGMLAVSAGLILYRLAQGPSVPDRVVALDALLLVISGGVAVTAAVTGETAFLRVLIVVALLGFVGTVTAARFVERRGG